MKKMKKSAQSVIEYGLILALVAVVAVAVMGKLGSSVGKAGNSASTALDAASTNASVNACKATLKPGSTTTYYSGYSNGACT